MPQHNGGMNMTPIEFVRYMVDTYRVHSCLEDDDEYNDIWFECPECGEPILYADYPEAFCIGAACPVCEEIEWGE